MKEVFVLMRKIENPFDEYEDIFNRTEKICAFPTREAAREALLAIERGEIEIYGDEDEADELERADVDYYIWKIPLFEGKAELLSEYPCAHLK